MNLREIWKEDTILDAGGNRSARRKPARASMDREPNSHMTLTRLGIEPGPHWWKAREQPLRQPARPMQLQDFRDIMVGKLCEIKQGGPEALSESPQCKDMVADLHFPPFFGTAIKCEIARCFLRSVVKEGLHVQCKKISILSGVHPWTSTDLKLSFFNT